MYMEKPHKRTLVHCIHVDNPTKEWNLVMNMPQGENPPAVRKSVTEWRVVRVDQKMVLPFTSIYTCMCAGTRSLTSRLEGAIQHYSATDRRHVCTYATYILVGHTRYEQGAASSEKTTLLPRLPSPPEFVRK